MIQLAPGILLIADPFLKDPHFIRSVIFICDHKSEGSVGFVLNKPIHQTLDELLGVFEGCPIPVYYGGPVQMDTLHFLHQYPAEIPGGSEVMTGIYWGGNFEKLVQLIKDNRIDLNKIRFFVGYSGWRSGQLEDELKEKTWLTASAIKKLIFNENPDNIWKESLLHLGGDYEQMIHFPIDPQLN